MIIKIETLLYYLSSGSNDIYQIYAEHPLLLLLAVSISVLLFVFFCINVAGHLIGLNFRFCFPAKSHPTLKHVFPGELNDADYPFVVVQLPMVNEIECCKSIIDCACNIIWPKTKLFIQVLDDSTEKEATEFVKHCVSKWCQSGIHIKEYRRPDRIGFKAGSLKNGMAFMPTADYVAIFDVDFLPQPDFLLRTIPPLIQDSTVAFVQARWTFTNGNESFLTQMQEIWFNFHHKCEQEGNYRASVFFGFNGTGAVWRVSAIEQCGGWHVDTLVEDMDISFRVYLNGWRFVYMTDVECLNEIPPTLSAYFSQQHRWTCGPVQIIRKLFVSIIRTKNITWTRKLWSLWFLFRIFNNVLQFLSLILLLPICVFLRISDVTFLIFLCIAILPMVPIFVFTPKKWFMILHYMLFTNAVSLHKCCAVFAGLFDRPSTKQWIVTPKFNCAKELMNQGLIEVHISGSKKNMIISPPDHVRSSIFGYCFALIEYVSSIQRRIIRYFRSAQFHKRYFSVAVYFCVVGYLGLIQKFYVLGFYCFANAVMFFIFSFGMIGR